MDGGNESADKVREHIDQAIQELGASVQVETVTDPDVMLSYGVAPQETPAVVMASYQLKSVKHIPEVVVIKEWLKNL